MHHICDGPFIWSKVIPIKISCFVWRAKLGQIPSLMALKGRGVNLGDTMCGGCRLCEEDCNHILKSCPIARQVMMAIWRWCDIDLDQHLTVRDLIHDICRWGNCKKRRIGLVSIVYGSLWCIWRARNDRVFNGATKTPAMIFEEIKAIVFVWLKHRASKGDIVWENWSSSPLSCM